MLRSMLTTSDNPFDPFDQFVEWYNFDVAKGYNTCAYLARIVVTSEDLSDADQAAATDQAIEEILQFNLTGNYVRLMRDVEEVEVDAVD